jgi:hypothetical protein
MKNGFFMTEKFNFENLSAFNSAEGRIFRYPLAVESDFQQLTRESFSNGRAVESSGARFCGRDHYSLFQLVLKICQRVMHH